MRILIISLNQDLDEAGEWSAIIGGGDKVAIIRGADRQKLELTLERQQYDVVHVAGHGHRLALVGEDVISGAELVTLLEGQHDLWFVVIQACGSIGLATAIHNRLHVPVVAYDDAVDDRAAVEFARAFYRAWRRTADLGLSVLRGRENVAALFDGEAGKVQLIDGDMITPTRFSAALDEISARLGELQRGIGELMARTERMENGMTAGQRRIEVLLLAALVVVQMAQMALMLVR